MQLLPAAGSRSKRGLLLVNCRARRDVGPGRAVHNSQATDLMADKTMSNNTSSEAAKAIVRRNTEEVQGKGNFDVFEELFADDFVDHTPQPNMTPDKAGARGLYKALREAFPDFHAVIHWQTADGEIVTTFKTYHGTHQGTFLGVPPTGRKIHFETVDAMRVHNGMITEHWGVANLFSLMQQLGAAVGSTRAQTGT